MDAVQDGAGAAAASSQGIGGMGGELVAGFVVVPKTSAQLRPGPGDVGAPGSVSPWLPPSAKESTRVGGCAIDISAFLSEFPALAPRVQSGQVKKAAAVCVGCTRPHRQCVCAGLLERPVAVSRRVLLSRQRAGATRDTPKTRQAQSSQLCAASDIRHTAAKHRPRSQRLSPHVADRRRRRADAALQHTALQWSSTSSDWGSATSATSRYEAWKQ